jgi:hypothetical protein
MKKKIEITDLSSKTIMETVSDDEERIKCMNSPYYFATKYLTINGKPVKIDMSEEEYNKMYNELQLKRRRRR